MKEGPTSRWRSPRAAVRLPPWQSTESVPGGKLYVPKLYAPLLPGSIYPDRKTPVPAKGRPAMVLVCPPRATAAKG